VVAEMSGGDKRVMVATMTHDSPWLW